MKNSIMINFNNFPKIGKKEVSNSAGGWYIGRLYYYSKDDYEPYDRISGYYPTKELADGTLVTNVFIDIRI